MKNALKFLLVYAVVFALICAAAPFVSAVDGDAAFEVQVVSSAVEAKEGDTLTFTVSVSNISADGGLISVDIPFRFDESVFEFVEKTVSFPSVWGNPDDFSYTQPRNGLLWLRMLDDEDKFSSSVGCTEDGAMSFSVVLKVKPDVEPGETTIEVNGGGMYEDIVGTCADGQCTSVDGSGGSVTVALVGGESPDDTTDDTTEEGLPGDVNFDGVVNNIDATCVLKHDAGLEPLSDEAFALADMNGDGNVDNIDASVILSIDAGVIAGK